MATITPNLGLTLPAAHDENWGVPTLNADFTLIDTFAGTAVRLSPAASQTIAQPVGTFLNLNAPMIYGALPVIRFGVLANVWDASLSRLGSGYLSIDTNIPGNGNGMLIANSVNAKAGFQFNGAAPSGHILVGNGTYFVDSPTIPSGSANYQIVEQAGTPITQRNKLNFLAPLTAVDNGGLATSDVGLGASGVAAGTYTAPTLTVDVFGRITAATNSSLNATTNSHGTYIQFPDGTYLMWGSATLPATSGDYSNVAITFPHAFVSAPTITGLVAIGSPRVGNQDTVAIGAVSLTTAGFTARGMCPVPTGGGGSTFDQNMTINWSAAGK